jgi:hypothetical protein
LGQITLGGPPLEFLQQKTGKNFHGWISLIGSFRVENNSPGTRSLISQNGTSPVLDSVTLRHRWHAFGRKAVCLLHLGADWKRTKPASKTLFKTIRDVISNIK